MEKSLVGTPYRADWHADGLQVTHAFSQYQSNIMQMFSSPTDSVRLHFGLKGDYEVTYKQFNTHFDFAGGHQNLFYAKGFEMAFQNKTSSIETFGIQFPVSRFLELAEGASDSLQEFAEKIAKGQDSLFSPTWAPIDPRTEKLIQEIVSNPYQGALQKMFLLAKSLELLVLTVESFAIHSAKKSKLKSHADRQKIITARDIIHNRLTDPPTLSELGKLAGINEYKLKTGFKEIFGDTVFNYLTNLRLQLAVRLLQDSSTSVADIAYELGYATPQHFNNAFRKKFGRTPNMVRKNP